MRLLDAPALVVRPASSSGRPRGCVLYLHGLSASKEAHPPELERLAARGFTAVALDAPHHGERRTAKLDALERLSGDQREPAIVDLVEEAADELPAVLEEASRRFEVPMNAVGVIGISFGGYTAYASALREPRAAAMVAVIASPQWTVDRAGSPHRHLNRFPPLPLLSITAGADPLVDPSRARRFHEQLGPVYEQAGLGDRLRYVELEGADHFMSAEHWAHTQELAAEWFERWLPAPTPSRGA